MEKGKKLHLAQKALPQSLDSLHPPPRLFSVLWTWWTAFIFWTLLWQTQAVSLSLFSFGLGCALFLVPMIGLEIRRRTLSDFFSHVFESRKRTSFFLFLFLVFAVKFYWIPGYRLYTMGDGAPHVLNAWMVFNALGNGEVPFWTNYWACGSPFLQFYPPLFSYLTAALLVVHDNIFLDLRILLSLLHILSGVTLYRLLRALGANRKGAFVGAVFYVLAPWHVFQLFHFNRFPVAPVYTLLPLLFLSIEILPRHRLGGLLMGSASLAGIALSHQGYAIFSGIFFGLYTCARALPCGGEPRCPGKTYIFHLAGTGILGMGLASFLLLPHLLESHLLPFLPSLGNLQGVKGFIMDSPYLLTLFTWKRQPMGHTGYIGLSLFLFSLPGIAGWMKKRGRGWGALLLCYLLSYYLVLGHENPLYRFIPFVYSQFYAGRFLIFFTFFLSLCAGLSLPVLEGWLRSGQHTRNATGSPPDTQKRPRTKSGFATNPAKATGRALSGFLRPRLFLVYLVILMMDIGPISHYLEISPRYPLKDQEQIYNTIREKKGKDPNRLARALDVPKDFRSRNHGSLILPFEALCPTPEAGQFGTLGSYAYIYKILKNARETLPLETTLPSSLEKALSLLNVRYLFTDVFPGKIARACGGENFGGPLWLFTFKDASPVLASPSIENLAANLKPPGDLLDFVLDRWDPPDTTDRILFAMDIDTAGRRARKILVQSGADTAPSFREPTGPIRVGAQELGTTFLRLTVSSASDCYLRISQSDYPHQRVLLDGTPCPRVFRSAMGFIVIPFPKGEHTVEVRAVLSPLRKFSLALSAVFTGLWIALLCVYLKKPKANP